MAYHIASTVTLVIFHIVLVHFSQHTKADMAINCTKFTYCVNKYADIYKSLTSDENSFNIESALYPSLEPSSLIVKVQIYGHNNTFVANYTWSLNCLYAAFPVTVLELLSLGAILVTPRTQDLKICVPDFCPNLSSVADQKALMKSVLAALEDVAISPGVRDPRLNTAECVTEGHTPNITATGRSSYIRTVIWSSFLCVLLMGPYLSTLILRLLNEFRKEPENHPSVKSTTCLIFFLSFAELVILINVVTCSASGNAPWDIYVILGFLFFESLVLFCLDCRGGEDDLLLRFVTRTAANLSLYHFCWLVVGIMTNPIWGLVVLLAVLFFCLALTFALFMIFKAECDCGAVFACVATFSGVCCLVLSAVFASQSFYGRGTAGDFLRTVLLYVIGALISWISWTRNVRGGSGENNAPLTSTGSSQ
ncbi:uncharacterized protein [Montipora foliosa]|uniref:uncharacterized protein isoform X1 n=1 Tax=Montipora foliosa TaxID=591990 RepID=UPI0035F1DC12